MALIVRREWNVGFVGYHLRLGNLKHKLDPPPGDDILDKIMNITCYKIGLFFVGLHGELSLGELYKNQKCNTGVVIHQRSSRQM